MTGCEIRKDKAFTLSFVILSDAHIPSLTDQAYAVRQLKADPSPAKP